MIPTMRSTTFLLTLSSIWHCCVSYNILILHPIFAGSHEMSLRSLGEHLVTQGHQVTQIRWLNSKSTIPVKSSVEVIDRRVNTSSLPSSPYFNQQGIFQIPTQLLWQRRRRLDRVPPDVYVLTHAHCSNLLGDTSLMDSLSSRNFSVALVDLIGNECGLAMAAALKLPTVGFWGFSFSGGESLLTSTLNLPSVVTTFLSDLGPEMTFWQRLYNTATLLVHKALLAKQTSIANYYIQKYYPGLPDVARLVHNVDIVLVMSNFFTSQPLLLPPNVQMIGCPQCRPAQPLSQNEKSFMDECGEDGVVLFSLGITGYEANSVPEDYLQIFLRVFARLKQKVLMRFSRKRLSGMHVPDNVHVVDWFNQLDLLGHKNTRLFISHCGMNGVMEAVYHGVPILGVPIFGDQGDNSKFIDYRRLGIGLDKFGLTEDVLYDAVTQLLHNKTIGDNVRRMSQIWRADNWQAMERAVHWINTVAQFAPLTHLRMVESHLSWYQYWLLDVMLVFLAAFLLLVYILWIMLRCCAQNVFYKLHSNGLYEKQKQQ